MRVKIKFQLLFIASVVSVVLVYFIYEIFSFIALLNHQNLSKDVHNLIDSFNTTVVINGVLIVVLCFVSAVILNNLFVKKITQIDDYLDKLINFKFDEISKIEYKFDDELSHIVNSTELLSKYLKHFTESSNKLSNIYWELIKQNSLDKFLETLSSKLEEIFNVKYVAISIFDDNKKVKKFFQRGLTEEQIRMIGRYRFTWIYS